MSDADRSPEWIRFRIKRWTGSLRVAELSLAERGLLTELTVLIAMRGAIRCGCDRTCDRICDQLAERIARLRQLRVDEVAQTLPRLVADGHLVFDPDEGGWVNETAMEERQRALRVSKAGSKGAAARWKNRRTESPPDATADAIASEPHADSQMPGRREIGDNQTPPTPRSGGSSADAEGRAVGVDPPDPEPGHDEPRGPRHVVASAPPLPPWAVEPLEEVRMRSPQRRAQTVEWAQQWCEPARVLRAVVGEVRKLKATEPAGLLVHAIESGKAEGWLEALDRGASPQSKPLARRAVPWDQELEAIVLGFAGHDRGYELVDAEELANQRYGGREAARRKFAEAVVHVLDVAQAADSVPSILPVGDYAETARRLLGGDSEVACG